MIHLLDGFNWPVNATTANATLDNHQNQPTSFFQFPPNPYVHPENGKGLFGARENTGSAMLHGLRIVARPALAFTNGKLVVGGSFYANNINTDGSRNIFGLLLCYTNDNYIGTLQERTSSNSADTALPVTRLPSLLFKGSTLMLRKHAASSSSMSASTYVASRDLTGVTSDGKHWFEVVYDFNTNTVEVFIDNVSVLLHPYAYTEDEKTASYRLQVSMQCHSSLPELYVTAVYAADERFGPCKVVAKYANADVSVPPAFGEGPHFQKLNGSFISTDTNKLVTKQNASAEFGLTPSEITGDVKGVTVLGRLSSTNRSAYETGADVQYGLKLPQGTWASNKIPVPTPVEATERIEAVMLDKNPLTGTAFTKDEINSLGLTITFDVTNKFTVAE